MVVWEIDDETKRARKGVFRREMGNKKVVMNVKDKLEKVDIYSKFRNITGSFISLQHDPICNSVRALTRIIKLIKQSKEIVSLDVCLGESAIR